MKYRTNAAEAENEINKLMRDQSSIPIKWHYLGQEIKPIVLETTLDEVPLYMDTESYLRPGYSHD